MNKFTKENVAIAIKNAIDDEKLMHKEAAKILGVKSLDFTYLKNEKYWDKISKRSWDLMQLWMHCGTKLKDYKATVMLVEQNNPPESEKEMEDIHQDVYKSESEAFWDRVGDLRKKNWANKQSGNKSETKEPTEGGKLSLKRHGTRVLDKPKEKDKNTCKPEEKDIILNIKIRLSIETP